MNKIYNNTLIKFLLIYTYTITIKYLYSPYNAHLGLYY